MFYIQTCLRNAMQTYNTQPLLRESNNRMRKGTSGTMIGWVHYDGISVEIGQVHYDGISVVKAGKDGSKHETSR